MSQKNRENLNPSYFAVIPAVVRYDNSLPHAARLLYGEISSLCNKEGYCWAGNAYFAELYGVSERTVSNWISALKDNGHISVNFRYVSGKKEIETRLIRLTCADTVKKVNNDNTDNTDDNPPKYPENSQNIDNIDLIEETEPDGGGEKIFNTYGKNFQQVLKKSSKGDEKIFRDNNINNNKNNTAAAPPPFDEPIPTVEDITQEAAAESLFTTKEFKQKLMAVNDQLFYDDQFYSRAVWFMKKHNLDYDYILFVHKQVERQEPRSFKALFFTMFFFEDVALEYIARRKAALEESKKDFEQNYASCPACGNYHGKYDGECPFCGLPNTHSAAEIKLYKQLYNLPTSVREEYFEKEKDIYKEFDAKNYSRDMADILELKKNNLKKEFGITA